MEDHLSSLFSAPWGVVAFYTSILAILLPIFWFFAKDVGLQAYRLADAVRSSRPKRTKAAKAKRDKLISYSLFGGKYLHCFGIFLIFQILKVIVLSRWNSGRLATALNAFYLLIVSAYMAHEWKTQIVPQSYPMIVLACFFFLPMATWAVVDKVPCANNDVFWSLILCLVLLFFWLSAVPVVYEPITTLLELRRTSGRAVGNSQ